MWIFLSDSFLSIVQDRKRPANLLVRARRRGDIKRVFGVKETETRRADYRFRASVPRAEVAAVMADQVNKIAYTNFKSSIRNPRLQDAAHDVWDIMHELQRPPSRLSEEIPW